MNGSQQQTYSDTDESGAQDNLLSLNPNDPRWQKVVGDWEDDKSYKNVVVDLRQISPGEYEVTRLKAAGVPAEEETPAEDASEPGEETDQGTTEAEPAMMSKNPAMDNYLKRKYGGA